MTKRHQATSANVEVYWQLFVNRRAYVLQSKRPHPDSGRYYYFRPKVGRNGEQLSLAPATMGPLRNARATIAFASLATWRRWDSFSIE